MDYGNLGNFGYHYPYGGEDHLYPYGGNDYMYENHGSRGPSYTGGYQQAPFERAHYMAGIQGIYNGAGFEQPINYNQPDRYSIGCSASRELSSSRGGAADDRLL